MTSISPLKAKVHKKSREVTFNIRKHILEYCSRVSDNAVVSQRVTSNNTNYIYTEDFRKLPAYFPVFIHNHNKNEPFSSTDIKILINGKAKKLYIGQPKGFESLEALKPELLKENRVKIIEEYNLEDCHNMAEKDLKKIAKDYKMIFSKVKWSDFR